MSTYDDVKSGNCDHNIRFADLCKLVIRLGFTMRVEGSHRIFSRPGILELITLQPDGAKAKAYQVRQVRTIIKRYGLEEIR